MRGRLMAINEVWTVYDNKNKQFDKHFFLLLMHKRLFMKRPLGQ